MPMYAIVNLADGSKHLEVQETPHLTDGKQACLPIEYPGDKPSHRKDEVAELTEGIQGGKWVKSWKVRKLKAAEKRAKRLAEIAKEERELSVLEVLEAILEDDAAKKDEILNKLRDLRTRRQAEG